MEKLILAVAILAVAILAAGCAAGTAPLDRAAVDSEMLARGRAVWAQHWADEMGGCSKDPEIVSLDRTPFEVTCAAGDSGCQAGDSIVMRAGLVEDQYREVLAHEIAHWLLSCSGVSVDGDPGHTITKVWGGYIPGRVAAGGLAGEIAR